MLTRTSRGLSTVRLGTRTSLLYAVRTEGAGQLAREGGGYSTKAAPQACCNRRVLCGTPQVIADFREDSPTFGRWCGVVLTEHNKKQVYVPPNCGHGFFTFEDNTCALYLQQAEKQAPRQP